MMEYSKFRGIQRVKGKSKDGNLRFYYYHRESRTRLPGEPGSAEFMAAYKGLQDKRIGHDLRGLIGRYRSSGSFGRLSKKTKADYALYLGRLENHQVSSAPIEILDDQRMRSSFVEWLDQWNDKPRARNYAITVLRLLLNWAIESGYLRENQARFIRKSPTDNRAGKTWSEAQISKFMQVASPEIRRAMLLALYTGQRRGDILKARWDDLDGDTIVFKQSKTGQVVSVPLPLEFLDEMANWPKTATTILASKTGNPWDARYFSRKWFDTTRKAGLADVHFHDLRGTVATRLAEAGCTNSQIASITGHSFRNVAQMLESYVNRSPKMAREAAVNLSWRLEN